MERYSVREAQDYLPKLMVDARHGKTILIMDENDQVVQLVPVSAPPKSRKAGSARGLIKIAPDFDAPLADFDEYMA
jgi:antitoxin (DNA-binding transcriptional repressor) of toxin-antitoxin stability system